MLVLSEESLDEVQKELKGQVGLRGIDEKWKDDKLVIERFVHTWFRYFDGVTL